MLLTSCYSTAIRNGWVLAICSATPPLATEPTPPPTPTRKAEVVTTAAAAKAAATDRPGQESSPGENVFGNYSRKYLFQKSQFQF